MAEPVISVIDMLQGVQEILAVLVVFINSFLFISTAGDMIDRSRKFYAQRTSHRETISKLWGYIKIKDLTPLMHLADFKTHDATMAFTQASYQFQRQRISSGRNGVTTTRSNIWTAERGEIVSCWLFILRLRR
jgi:hypothetical protein